MRTKLQWDHQRVVELGTMSASSVILGLGASGAGISKIEDARAYGPSVNTPELVSRDTSTIATSPVMFPWEGTSFDKSWLPILSLAFSHAYGASAKGAQLNTWCTVTQEKPLTSVAAAFLNGAKTASWQHRNRPQRQAIISVFDMQYQKSLITGDLLSTDLSRVSMLPAKRRRDTLG
ncbi:hypothetical protein GY45DRAFT_297643 [Cubamyces sp. BRFM 1775]|nr:hypothetical protein GY45DRAFT_297643 [Cubamyces sp. BRFM 1775]